MALVVDIKVVPQAGRSGFELNKQGKLVAFLKSAPEKGQANKELIKNLSKALKIAQQDIEIISGLISKNKKIKMHGAISKDLFYEKLGLNFQVNFLNVLK